MPGARLLGFPATLSLETQDSWMNPAIWRGALDRPVRSPKASRGRNSPEDESAAPGRQQIPEDDRRIPVPGATVAPGPVAFGLGLTLGAFEQPEFRQPGRQAGFGRPAAGAHPPVGLPHARAARSPA